MTILGVLLWAGCGDGGASDGDSGTDAGLDAEAHDAGWDGGPVDAGNLDARGADAGDVDGGSADADLLDAGDLDAGTDATVTDGGPSLTEAAAAFHASCYDECDTLVTCAPGVSTLEECQAECDAERTRRETAAAAGTPVDEVIACFLAKKAEHECLVSQTCDDFIEHYTRLDGDFPCEAEESAQEGACSTS